MNYKSISIIAVTLCMALGVNAQTMLDSLISRYDSLQPYVPTGILADRNPSSGIIANWVDPLHHSGLVDSSLTFDQFKRLYKWIYFSTYTPNSLFNTPPNDLDSLLEIARYGTYIQNLPLSQQITYKPKADAELCLLALNYNQISQMAWDSTLIRFDSTDFVFKLNSGNIYLNDTVWLDSTNLNNYLVVDTTVWLDPIQTAVNAFAQEQLLALCAFNPVAYVPTPQVKFLLNPVGQYSNFISNLEIDFGNGNGFIPLPADSITINYPTFGQFEITLRINDGCNGAECQTATTTLKVVHTQPPAYSVVYPQAVNSCSIPTPEGIGEGLGHFFLRFDSISPPTGIMRPIILVEGIETKPNNDPVIDPCDFYGCGELNWKSLSTGVFSGGSSPLDSIKYFIDSLRYAGFDVIIADFRTNRAQIQKNGNLLINLIQHVNAQLKANSSKEEIVVIGASMGGLIARYAVRKMEMVNCCHNAKLFVTFSTPHRGANIPLGLQQFLYHLGNGQNPLGEGDAAKETYNYILNSPVARQMLVMHRDASAVQERQAFQAMLDSIGQPQECRIVALTNGSETALGQNNKGNFLQGGDPLVEIHLKTKVPVVVPDLFIVPIMQAASLANKKLSNGNFTLVNSKAFAVQGSSTPHVVLERGDNFNANMNRLITQDLIYLGGMSALTINGIVHGAAFWSALLASTGVCVVCPPIGVSKIVSTAAISATFSSALLVHKNYNQNTNLSNTQYWEYANNTLSYDNAPGDYATTQADIQELGGGLVQSYFPHHNFISSVSALDINTTNLALDIDQAQILDYKLTPFKNYWAPPRKGEISPNQAHVQVGMSNIQWVLNEVRNTNYDLREQNDPKYKNLNTYYNFARPADETVPFQQFVRRVDIQVNGQLHVNNFGPIGYISGSQTPTEYTNFVLKTSAGYCDSVNLVVIKNGGQFIIGDDNYSAIGASNTAAMYFRENSTLEIESGGTLRINDNSTLVLEPGAELIIHPGASIDLAGANAVLELQGKVTLLAGASLNPSGSGIVRFAQAMQSAADAPLFWDVVSSTQVRIVGNNGQKRAEITQTLYLPTKLDSVVFSGVTATFAEDASLHVSTPPVRLQNSFFIGADTTQQHNGVHLAGQGALVSGSSFKHGTVGLYNNLSLGSGSFSVTQCNFSHNSVGLHVRDGNVEAVQCTARYNQTGLLQEDAQGDMQVNGGIYAHNTTAGIDVAGQTGVTLYANEVALNNNALAINAIGVDVRPQCCNFTASTTGISAYYNNFVHLQDGAQNLFVGNTGGSVLLNQCAGVFLANGLNNFSGSQWYVFGELTALNANPTVDVLDNNMPGTSSGGSTVSVPINVYWLTPQGNQSQVPVSNWSSTVNLPASCSPLPGSANPGNTLAHSLLMGFTSTKVVNTTNYTNVWLHQALADAAYKVSTPDAVYNDLLAIARFSEIMGSISGTYTDLEIQALNVAVELMVTALNNAYSQGLVPTNGAVEGNPENAYLHMVTEQLNSRLGSTGINAEEMFNMNLALAQTYRMAEHFDYALNVLDNLANPVSAEQLVHSDYWACVCEAENRLLNEEISVDEFTVEQENCRNLLMQFQKWQNQIVPGYTEVGNANGDVILFNPLYPNPASNGVLIELTNAGNPAKITLLDITGKVIHEENIAATERSTLLDLRRYNAGVYLIRVVQNQQEHVQRLVVTK